MWRICSCVRGGEWENRTGLVHDYVYDVDICSNCGGVVPPKGSDKCGTKVINDVSEVDSLDIEDEINEMFVVNVETN